MAGLHVYRSNRLEALAHALATLAATPVGDVLEREIVVVQSLGMRRWLSFELARQLGVTMNVSFPFPAALAREVFHAAFGEDDGEDAFARDILPWRVLGSMARNLDAPGWELLRAYVHGERGALKRYQLAHKIAAVFDRYLAYRPELLLEWQAKRSGGDWQSQLWRDLVRGRRERHPPALLRTFQDRSPTATLPGLPTRISVFGISTLPPFYLHLFQTAARHLDVHLFLLEPTDQYWGDIESRREQDRRLAAGHATAEDLHLDSGNPLLASLGKVGRDLTRLVQDLEPITAPDSFQPPARTTLLARVQADIFELTERTPGECEPLPEFDNSIRVHCCHGPMREVEVLHDQLLDLFERVPGLTPRDILVAMPDVDTYAPFIEAVFGCPEDERLAIPFTVADRSARTENSLADTFLRLLDLHGSRFAAPAVLALLDHAAVRGRYGLEESELPTIRRWIGATGIRWGIDAEHREGMDLPKFADNTWRAGLDRLLLGYALPGDDGTIFDHVLPVREIEGAPATTLGNFAEFAETLFDRVPRLGTARAPADWSQFLLQLVGAFFAETDESADELRHLRGILTAFATHTHAADFAEVLEFEVVRAHLGAALGDTESGTGFLAGRVTFCSLKPMRAIPFQVICLLGMNDAAFPRRDTTLAFDLLSTDRPRRGDRSQRDDDRHLFLEAILSARAAFRLSYCGLSPRDNSEAPPSVVVTELLDYLEQNYSLPDTNLRDAIVTRHRLQAFSPAYFTEHSPLFSYSGENALSCAQQRAPRIVAANFASGLLPPPEPEWHAVEVDNLAEFFAHPAKFFCRERLRLAHPEESAPLEEVEPLTLHHLDRYQLGEEFTELALRGAPLSGQLPVVRASGVLPFGCAGDAEFAALREQSHALGATIRRLVPDPAHDPLSVDVESGPWRLTGVLRGIHDTAMVRHRAAQVKAKDFLRAWIFHVALQFTTGGPRETLLFGVDGAWKFRALDDAPARLADLLDLYAEGLRAPLPLLPETSFEFCRRTHRASARLRSDPLDEARKKWDGTEFNRGESDDPWFRRCFPPSTDPLTERWQEIALRVFAPLIDSREEVGE